MWFVSCNASWKTCNEITWNKWAILSTIDCRFWLLDRDIWWKLESGKWKSRKMTEWGLFCFSSLFADLLFYLFLSCGFPQTRSCVEVKLQLKHFLCDTSRSISLSGTLTGGPACFLMCNLFHFPLLLSIFFSLQSVSSSHFHCTSCTPMRELPFVSACLDDRD